MCAMDGRETDALRQKYERKHRFRTRCIANVIVLTQECPRMLSKTYEDSDHHCLLHFRSLLFRNGNTVECATEHETMKLHQPDTIQHPPEIILAVKNM